MNMAEKEAAPSGAQLEIVAAPLTGWDLVGYIALDYAMKYLDSGVFSQWQSMVGPQLQRLATMLMDIAEQINQIIPKVRQELLHQTITDFTTEIEAHRTAAERIKSRVGDRELSPTDLTEVTYHKAQADTRVDQLMNYNAYGFTGYPGVISGAATMMLLNNLLNIDRAQTRSYLAGPIDDYLAKALDPTISSSLQEARNRAENDAIGASVSFAELLGTRWRICYAQYDDPNANYTDGHHAVQKFYDYRIATFSGQVDDSDVTVAFEDFPAKTSRPDEPWMPDLPEHYDYGDHNKALEKATDVVRRRKEAAQAARAIVATLDSHIGQIRRCRTRLRTQG